MSADYRESILHLVESEFMGPCPDENPVKNGEEIIEGESPLHRYTVGILYPKEQRIDDVVTAPDDAFAKMREQDADGQGGPSPIVESIEEHDDQPLSTEDHEDDPVNLSNAYRQSAVSLSVKFASDVHTVSLSVRFGLYGKTKSLKNGKKIDAYPRTQEEVHLDFGASDLPASENGPYRKCIFNQGAARLQLVITNRQTGDNRTVGMYTFSLINMNDSNGNGFDCEACFFQVEFSVMSDTPLMPLQDSARSHAGDEDYLNNQLLYRGVNAYGMGHGCAASWNQQAGDVRCVRASFIPSFEVRPIVPATGGLVFDMLKMSESSNREHTLHALSDLCSTYEEWVTSIEQETTCLNTAYVEAAQSNVKNCRTCLDRMRSGVELLRTDATAFKAFCLMNEAMLSQQLHYRMPLAKWKGGREGRYEGLGSEVNPKDNSTWPNTEAYGKWRTFQIAFILMNLRSMREEDCKERSLVDLIWFPTGGGKTEAYLGLTAFTLFLRRMINQNDCGVTVLMRYTLRLLTTQQFERASSMICACEAIRERMPDTLGEDRFSIGLWVGQSTSPNTQKDAVETLSKMRSGKSKDNPFILLKCPWCGAEMGVIESSGRQPTIKGYDLRPKQGPHGKAAPDFYYACSNPVCHFGKENHSSLPIYSIDEDVYKYRPSLVIGTVDKFASLATTPETRNLFGRGKVKCSPPDLIIQDELHLISGPLGSMVGFYETAVDVLCTDDAGNHAKIIGSTATISHAKEQCAALYGRPKEDVSLFPPSGVNASDSFFAVEEPNPDKPGRLYVGICAPGSSMAMSVINLYASLLLAPDIVDKDIPLTVRDGYQTNLGYFNSLRELGRAATWISGNVLENLKAMQTRRWHSDSTFKGRNPNWINSCELTSRISSVEIPSSLKKLEIGLRPDGNSQPIDVCLATNMISVGVDIPRLALMTIDGQPKTTSEYIQASSRVGRGDNPGLVFTIFSPSKARDKSHYEDFQRYHSRLYCNVEPTSITPFSTPLRDRAMRALLVALVRQLSPITDVDNPQFVSRDSIFAEAESIILDRVSAVDNDELDSTSSQIRGLLSNWKTMNPQQYMSKTNDPVTPLIMRVNSKLGFEWDRKKIWEVPSSMRTVDAECQVKAISEYVGGRSNDE